MAISFFLFLCASLFSCTNGGTIKLAMPSNSSPSFSPLSGTVSLSSDPRFSLQPHYTTTRISALATLMNTVTFLSQAADYGFESFLDITRRASFPDYPSAIIDIQTAKAKDRLQSFLLIWALYESAWDMVAKNKFFVSEFDIVWKGKVVARLRYTTPPDGAIKKSVGLGEQKGNKTVAAVKVTLSQAESASSPHTALLPLNTTTNAVLGMRVQYIRNGSVLPIYAVFMTVMAALVKNAYYPAKTRVGPFDASTPGFNAEIAISTTTGSSSYQAPSFERGHLNHAIKQLLTFMLEQRKFAEIAFSVMLDDEE